MKHHRNEQALTPQPDPTQTGEISHLFQLRRITTSGSYIPEIDGLCFLAILAVVLYHVPFHIALRSDDQITTSPFWRTISHGERGAQLFFGISGLILGMPAVACVGLVLHVLVERPCMEKSCPGKLHRWVRPPVAQT